MIQYDVAKILRRNYFNIERAATVAWRLGISEADVALAPCLSTPQRLDLIKAVDQLVNRPNLSNRKETIMNPDEERADVMDKTLVESEDDLNKALSDTPQTEAMEDQDRQADLDQCCGTDPTLDQEQTGKAVFKPMFQEGQDKVESDTQYPKGIPGLDPDRERITRGDFRGLPTHPDQTIPGNRSPAREEVYKLLDGEREYQRIRCANHMVDDSKWSPNDWLVFIEQYLYDARELTGNPGLQMDEIRKIGGLVVAAMENIPTPSRV